MKGTYYAGIAGIWIVFWIVQMAFRLIGNLDYYLYTSDGRIMLMFMILMIVAGVAVFAFVYLRINGDQVAYKFSKKDRCPECHAKLHGSSFCTKCGNDLSEKSKTRTCWNCGHVEEDPAVTSCPKCGREFKKER